MLASQITFDPLIPLTLLIALGALATIVLASGLLLRARGTSLRLVAFAALLIALANPSLSNETREMLDDVVAIVADRSQSQTIGGRTAATEEALAHLREKLSVEGIDLRVLDAGGGVNAEGTYLFGALEAELADVPPERVGGVIVLSDGQVHDAPESAAAAGLDAPVHALITGVKSEADRKLSIIAAPRFGIVGESLTFTVRVEDLGPRPAGEPVRSTARLSVAFDGAPPTTQPVPIGADYAVEFALAHGGPNVIEVEVDAGPGELTLQNNRAVIVTNGIRDRLRVLLVSGEPHAGERTWRNLLKADPAVELVHFTILRPPEKQDSTPNDELALIGFPVRELFSERLYDFDLIIFDRYRRREVIQSIYFSYMADFVEQGGAILIASGPDYNSPYSIATTALAPLLPAQPTATTIEEGFRPRVTDLGQRHPVTSGLPGANPPGTNEDAEWGRWFRLIDTQVGFGEVVMTGARDRPLLVLGEAGRGRVAQLLSDHAWLWARGLEGGGPQAELLRRLAHWLMKEPDLEEEVLSGEVQGSQLNIARRTMAESAEPVTVSRPSGAEERVDLVESAPGRFGASVAIDEVGLYRLSDGTLTTIVAVGPLNPLEVADMRATDEHLLPVTTSSGGGIAWIGDTSGAKDIPGIRFVRPERAVSGRGWIGIRRNEQFIVSSVDEIPLVPPALAALVGGLAFLLAWRREGR